MEVIDNDLGRLIRRQSRQKSAPKLLPHHTLKNFGLQLGSQQRPGVTSEALDHMAEINPP